MTDVERLCLPVHSIHGPLLVRCCSIPSNRLTMEEKAYGNPGDRQGVG
jgi:hypothetical protein